MDSIILTDDSADVYNPKSIRASMGAIFKQPIVKRTNDEIHEIRKTGVRFIGTSNSTRAIDARQAEFNNTVIILGNEGRGISHSFLALCDEVVKIPLSPGCESLNVAIAASIIMWEASKRTGGKICHH
jgi:TrmH family RNA methyltransferase